MTLSFLLPLRGLLGAGPLMGTRVECAGKEWVSLFAKLIFLILISPCSHLTPGAVLDQGLVPFSLEIPHRG